MIAEMEILAKEQMSLVNQPSGGANIFEVKKDANFSDFDLLGIVKIYKLKLNTLELKSEILNMILKSNIWKLSEIWIPKAEIQNRQFQILHPKSEIQNSKSGVPNLKS